MRGPEVRFTARVFTSLCIAILPGCAGCFLGGSATSVGSRWDIFAGGGSYPGIHPSVSPDGLSVVYSTPATGHGDIYRFDRTTGRNVRLTTDPEYDGYPLFSRDGKHVVFERETGGISHLWIMDADGRNQKSLTDGPTFDFGASFTKDGRTIVFCRNREGVSHVWLMDADAGHQRAHTDGAWFDSLPSFSPDGDRIVFRRMEENRIRLTPVTGSTSLRIPEIFVMNADGSDRRRLTQNLGDESPISFSSDGKRIFYYRENEYGKAPSFKGISVMDADGSNSRDLGEGSTPAVTPDGERLAFITGVYGRSVGLMNSDGTGRRTIHSCEFYHSEPTFTSDGSHVVFVEWPEEHGAGRIKILDLETTKTEMAPEIK